MVLFQHEGMLLLYNLPFIFCSGEIKNGNYLLEWMTDEDNRELVDEIENVNTAMFDQLMAQSTYLAALFCEYIRCTRVHYHNMRSFKDVYSLCFFKV